MNYFKLHIGDYEAHTGELSILEDGIYSRLLRRYYLQEKPFPNDLKLIARTIRARSRHEVDALARCVNLYFSELSDGKLHNSRADEEILKYHKRAEANRINGGGRMGSDSHDSGPLSHKPLATNHKPKGSNRQPDISSGWWSSESGIEATAKTLGINLGSKTYQQVKEECFEVINKRKNGKDKPVEKPTEPQCPRCHGSLAAGWNQQSDGRVCNPCYYSQIGHAGAENTENNVSK